MEVHVFTRDDVEFLKQALTNLRNISVNPQQLPSDSASALVQSYDQATSTYLVLTPAKGIARATPGTAPNSLATPTGAICRVIQQNNVIQPPQLFLVPNLTVPVWNYDLHGAVAGNQIVPVIQNAFGDWVPVGTVDEGTGTGSGTGTGTDTPAERAYCGLAYLRHTNCVRVVGPSNVLVLKYSSSGWVSAAGALLLYPGGSGAVEFWYAGGSLHLSVGGLELLNCGDGCFRGGALTGHEPSGAVGTGTGSGTGELEPCSGVTFQVCVTCVECPCTSIAGWEGAGWYCVGSPTCLPVELIEEDRCNHSIHICSGPYATEALAQAVCPAGTGTGTTSSPCSPDPVPDDLVVVIAGTGDCTAVAGSYPVRWNGASQWTGVYTVRGVVCDVAVFCAGSQTDPFLWEASITPRTTYLGFNALLHLVTSTPFLTEHSGFFTPSTIGARPQFCTGQVDIVVHS